jgi:RNA polymerase sigma factor (sigma-70 family)
LPEGNKIMSPSYFTATAFAECSPADPIRRSEQTPAAKDAGSAGHVIPFDSRERRLVSWMRCAQAGDRAAYDQLLRVSIPFIKMVARKQGVPSDAVDDVVQETLLTLHRSLMEYDPNRPYTAWLRTIARRRAIDLLRGQGRTGLREIHEPVEFDNHPDPAATPEDEVEQTGRRQFLRTVAASLPTRQLEAVEQLALAGKSLAEAAIATGQTQGALTVNLHRALNALRARFEGGKLANGFA